MTHDDRSTSRREWLGLAASAMVSYDGLQAAPARTGATTIEELTSQMSKAAKVVEASASRGGAGQLYVSMGGKVIADVAWGKTVDDRDVIPETIVMWASAMKPSTCTCLLKLWDRGKVDLDDKVTKFIPEFGENGKGEVRLRHLLTHTAHLGGYGGPGNVSPRFEDTVNKIVAAPFAAYPNQKTLPPLGTGPGYNPAGIYIVAEVCRRLYGKDFSEIVRTEVFEPAGMMNAWCGMPRDRYRAYKSKGLIGNFRRAAATPEQVARVRARGAATTPDEGNVSTGLANENDAALIQPAGGGVSPTRELGRFYEVMLARGTWNGHRILSPQAVEAATTPKTGLCYMGIWGLGFNLAIPERVVVPQDLGGERLQYRYGRHCSPRTFGHAGASGMLAFADPEHGLAVTCIGRLPVADAIYEDLGLVKAV